MFNLVPFAGAWGKMAHSDCEACFFSQYCEFGSAEGLVDSGFCVLCRECDSVHHSDLELYRGEFPEPALSALAVILRFDPVHDREA